MHSTNAADLAHANQLSDLYARERAAMVDFLLSLASFDRERRWERLGYSSLFSFLTSFLKMPESTAGCRLRRSSVNAGSI